MPETQILIVYHADWINGNAVHALAENLLHSKNILCFVISTKDPRAPDLRLWDISKLSPIELHEIENLVREQISR